MELWKEAEVVKLKYIFTVKETTQGGKQIIYENPIAHLIQKIL